MTAAERSRSIISMTDSPPLPPAKREEKAERNQRLARALRENLHRRKRRARAQQQSATPLAADKRTEDPPA